MTAVSYHDRANALWMNSEFRNVYVHLDLLAKNATMTFALSSVWITASVYAVLRRSPATASQVTQVGAVRLVSSAPIHPNALPEHPTQHPLFVTDLTVSMVESVSPFEVRLIVAVPTKALSVPRCECLADWTGPRCQYRKSCLNYCFNGGTCSLNPDEDLKPTCL